MIHDLDETLRQLLIQYGGLSPDQVDVSFEAPRREWSGPITRPTVNLYLYDIRENAELRESYWDTELDGNRRVRIKRRPLRIDLAYIVTCWTSTPEDQHRLLWTVLETLFRNSPLPDDILQGDLQQLLHTARTMVAQPDSALKNPWDFWGAMQNELQPSINLVVTLDLDLNQVRSAPLVFAHALKFGRAATGRDGNGHEILLEKLEPGWEVGPLQVGGIVHTPDNQPVAAASVRLIGTRAGRAAQFGPTVQTGPDGRYVFGAVPTGDYTLVVETAGRPPQQHPFTIAVGDRGETLPAFVCEVEVPMT